MVVDTCIIESALRSKSGASYQILSHIYTGLFRYGISVPLFLEYEYRIEELWNQKIISISKAGKEAILKALAHYCDEVPIFYAIRPNLKDENDNMVFECAVNFNADAIITYNIKDFIRGDLSPYAIEILTPQQVLNEVK
ncbi:MAG: putative toxin-antitoxin system toxin component, PIN family [Calditrichota bacterium]